MAKITHIVDTCTIRIDSNWVWGPFQASTVRMSGVIPPPTIEERKAEVNRMQDALIGRELKIVAGVLVETGPTLVAEVMIEDIQLQEFFSGRMIEIPSRPGRAEPEERRVIRAVRGRLSQLWSNPLTRAAVQHQPALFNFDFPTDPWLRDFSSRMSLINAVFCEKREATEQDYRAVSRFLSQRAERVLLLFGDCAAGKSWFIRHFLFAKSPPLDMDIAILDSSTFTIGEGFECRLHLRLSEVLGELVNKRKGGLLSALKPFLEREIAGVFPGEPFDSPQGLGRRPELVGGGSGSQTAPIPAKKASC